MSSPTVFGAESVFLGVVSPFPFTACHQCLTSCGVPSSQTDHSAVILDLYEKAQQYDRYLPAATKRRRAVRDSVMAKELVYQRRFDAAMALLQPLLVSTWTCPPVAPPCLCWTSSPPPPSYYDTCAAALICVCVGPTSHSLTLPCAPCCLRCTGLVCGGPVVAAVRGRGSPPHALL